MIRHLFLCGSQNWQEWCAQLCTASCQADITWASKLFHQWNGLNQHNASFSNRFCSFLALFLHLQPEDSFRLQKYPSAYRAYVFQCSKHYVYAQIHLVGISNFWFQHKNVLTVDVWFHRGWKLFRPEWKLCVWPTIQPADFTRIAILCELRYFPELLWCPLHLIQIWRNGGIWCPGIEQRVEAEHQRKTSIFVYILFCDRMHFLQDVLIQF